jgi:hypothetical protein
MTKYLNIYNENYKIKVQSGGRITLDTGLNTGEVVITGNLRIEGTTTTIESQNTVIKDNIIRLNDGETGNGVSLKESGLVIDRGNFVDVEWVFDEEIDWRDPATGSDSSGAWVAQDVNGKIYGIRTVSIDTSGSDLYLINRGSGVISVIGTANYENNVTQDDHIPNKRYVDLLFQQTQPQDKIFEGSASETSVETFDFEITGSPSKIDFKVDNNVVASMGATRTTIGQLQIENNEIFGAGGSPLTLKSLSAEVAIDDSVIILSSSGLLSAPADGVRIYARDEAGGGTGLYFVNSTATRDELISRNRALVYSMLF